jgi:hypothetical protein
MSFGKWFAEKGATDKEKAADKIKPAPGTTAPATQPDAKPAEIKPPPKQ